MNTIESQMQLTEHIKIWIIEDHYQTRQLFVNYLVGVDTFECTADFSNCEDAFQFIKDNAAPDIILLDVNLPGISGIQALPIFKNLLPDTKIIIMTLHSDVEIVCHVLANGASGFYWKGAELKNLVGIINDITMGNRKVDNDTRRRLEIRNICIPSDLNSSFVESVTT